MKRIRAALAASVLTMAMVTLVSPSPAHAALVAGDGWWARWQYDNGALMSFSAGLPGVTVAGSGWDAVGTRAFVVTVSDTKVDGKCAWAQFWSNGTNSEKTVCGNGSSVQFTPPSTIWPIFVNLCRNSGAGTATSNCNYLYIPPSKDDVGLRSPGTGMTWHYTSYDPSDPQHSLDGFLFDVTRSGVAVTGWGVHETSTRQTHASVSHPGGGLGCADARLSDAQISATASTCGGGSATMPVRHFVGWIAVEACHWIFVFNGAPNKRCLGGHVVMPN